MNVTALLPRLCRSCGKSSRETAFPTMSKHLCTTCKEASRTARADRIVARGPRVAETVREDAGDCPKHLAWVRRLPCAVRGSDCQGPVHAHHVRDQSGGGTGLKPADRWAVPLCGGPGHHGELHQNGARTFEAKYQIDLRSLAVKLAAASPHIKPETST